MRMQTKSRRSPRPLRFFGKAPVAVPGRPAETRRNAEAGC